ncbi:MAG: response regulator transcription factor [Burkholderiaceae bacterium]|jgi:DNA-binding response OmpR family regulator|nr:response regulator transcription factor [Burkholderiaceae bacterium]
MTTQHPLLIIDDDQRLSGMVSEYLSQSGYTVERAYEGAAGLAALQHNQYDLVILDLMLPDMDGLDVCRQIRALPIQASNVPVLMLTAKGDPMDRVIGLELGADDYLSKPFEPRELLARVRTILRRNGNAPAPSSAMRFGALEIDPGARRATLNGELIMLTSYQFDLLVALAEHAGHVLSRDQIMEQVRGREMESFDRSIDVHIGRIRSAIETDAKNPKRILTVRGMGYVFVKHQN